MSPTPRSIRNSGTSSTSCSELKDWFGEDRFKTGPADLRRFQHRAARGRCVEPQAVAQRREPHAGRDRRRSTSCSPAITAGPTSSASTCPMAQSSIRGGAIARIDWELGQPRPPPRPHLGHRRHRRAYHRRRDHPPGPRLERQAVRPRPRHRPFPRPANEMTASSSAPAPISSRSSASRAPCASATSSPSAAPRRSPPVAARRRRAMSMARRSASSRSSARRWPMPAAGFEHVTRTRVILTDMALWDDAAKAHAEIFRRHPPGDDGDGRSPASSIRTG